MKLSRKIILHIPHSSTHIPIKDGYIATEDEIDKEILKLTDWHTDDLFWHPETIPVIAPFSRIFCDVERFPEDKDEIMSQVGMGMLYEKMDNGMPLRTIDQALRKRIYDNFYRVHHSRLSRAVEEQLDTYGKCIIIDCHSFANTPFIRDRDQKIIRPQIDIGTDGYHTSRELLERSSQYFQSMGYSCDIDRPYNGSIVPLEYYEKDKRVESIMIEVNRDLYLENGTNMKSKNYDSTKKMLHGFLEEIWENYMKNLR